MAQLQDFSGGLNTRVTPSLISPIEAQVYTNIDPAKGSINPVKSAVSILDSADKYFTYYYANEEWVFDSEETSYVEYRDILYSTHLNSYPTKYDGTNTYRLGIVGPDDKVIVSVGAAGNLTGTYTYLYTYYNSSDGTESQPTPLSEDVVVSSQQIDISGIITSTDPQVDKVRLYRIGGDLASYTLVTELNNGTKVYTDDTKDIDIAGNHILDSISYAEAPDNLMYLTESYAMLFGAIDDKLYYSNIAKPNAWPVTNYVDFDDTITGIGAVQNGLLVFTKFKTYIISGNSPLTLTKYLLNSNQGCISHYTIKFTDNILAWVSTDGLCASNGGSVEVLTMTKLGKQSFTNIHSADVLDRVYYLAYEDNILVYDFRFAPIIRTMDESYDSIGTYNDSLYGVKDGKLYELFSGDNLTYTWKSALLTEGSFSTLKTYKDFYIRYNGDVNLKLWLDGRLLNDVNLSGDNCYNLKALHGSRGYGIEIQLEGTAEIYEIAYKVEGRQK